jgi:integrase
VLVTIASMLSAAVDDGLVERNVAHGAGRRLFRSDATVRPRRHLTRDELGRLLEAAGRVVPAYADYLLCLARTGLRPGEALALTWDDVDLVGRRLRVGRTWTRDGLAPPKTGRWRFVDCSGQLAEVLAARRAGRDGPTFVFESSRGGRPYSTARLQQVMKLALAAAGLPGHFRLHDLRHTWATLILDGGWSLKYAQRSLGHATIAMTGDVYAPQAQGRCLAAVDSLDDAGRSRRPPLRLIPGGRHPSSVRPPRRTA